MKMQIIKTKQDDGRTEYQVSDGDIGERSYSCDFDTLNEAELWSKNKILSDENKKMAEYLLYLNECNKIPLERDGFGWLLKRSNV